jgi:hypothetical protein
MRYLLVPLLFLTGCGGILGPIEWPDDPQPPSPAPLPAPRMPAVAATVIGLPGTRVPGMNASYVETGAGWLSPSGEVVFQAILLDDATTTLLCGIFRRSVAGLVNPVILQEQELPGTGGGYVQHPHLPLAAAGGDLVIPVEIADGLKDVGLFVVPAEGGTPLLVASVDEGAFEQARLLGEGDLLVEVATADDRAVVHVTEEAPPETLAVGIEKGYSTDGTTVVVRKEGAALAVEVESAAQRTIVGPGDPAPGSAGSVIEVREAWITEGGDFVVHADTNDPIHPDVLVRIGPALAAPPELVAACGAPAPGTDGLFGSLEPASGQESAQTDEVIFGAGILGDPAVGGAVYCAEAGKEPELIASTGDPAADLAGASVDPRPAEVALEEGATLFTAEILRSGAEVATGLFAQEAGEPLERLLTTDAPLSGLPGARIDSLLLPVGEAVQIREGVGTLVHAGILLDENPDEVVGALLLRPSS